MSSRRYRKRGHVVVAVVLDILSFFFFRVIFSWICNKKTKEGINESKKEILTTFGFSSSSQVSCTLMFKLFAHLKHELAKVGDDGVPCVWHVGGCHRVVCHPDVFKVARR